MRAIIIGGVAAGMSAASKLRRLDPGAEIAVTNGAASFPTARAAFHIMSAALTTTPAS